MLYIMREERRWPRGQCTELLSVPGKDTNPHVASFLREVSKGNGKLLGKLKEFLRIKCVGLVLLSGGVHRGYAVVTWCQNNRDKLPQRGRLRSREGAYRSTIFKFKLWKFSKIFMLQEDTLQNVSFIWEREDTVRVVHQALPVFPPKVQLVYIAKVINGSDLSLRKWFDAVSFCSLVNVVQNVYT